MAQLAKQFAIIDKKSANDFRDAEHILAMQDWEKNVVLQMVAKLNHLLAMPASPTAECIVSKPVLYHLIIRSDCPKAETFNAWVTEEVLPTIRKTGSYSVVPAPPLPPREQQIAKALFLSQETIKEQKEKIGRL